MSTDYTDYGDLKAKNLWLTAGAVVARKTEYLAGFYCKGDVVNALRPLKVREGFSTSMAYMQESGWLIRTTCRYVARPPNKG